MRPHKIALVTSLGLHALLEVVQEGRPGLDRWAFLARNKRIKLVAARKAYAAAGAL